MLDSFYHVRKNSTLQICVTSRTSFVISGNSYFYLLRSYCIFIMKTLVFTFSGADKVKPSHLSGLFIGLTARRKQASVAWFPPRSNRSTKKSHISITAPSGAIKSMVNDSPCFPPPPLSCDALRSLVFSYYNSYTWTSSRIKCSGNKRESQSALAAVTMTHIPPQTFMHSYPLTFCAGTIYWNFKVKGVNL